LIFIIGTNFDFHYFVISNYISKKNKSDFLK
jgi:hypothetical protein